MAVPEYVRLTTELEFEVTDAEALREAACRRRAGLPVAEADDWDDTEFERPHVAALFLIDLLRILELEPPAGLELIATAASARLIPRDEDEDQEEA